ncbi:MAG: RNA polymerase sigma factor [Oscillospiraceae bacterium]|nr:RNA polymerase sigma factor [Oscillospiraceae bacterium]
MECETNQQCDKLTKSIIAYRETVFQVALGYVKNIHDADDIAQNVFLKLCNHKKAFISPEAEKAWLIRVAINEAKDLLGSAWKRNQSSFDESFGVPFSVNDEDLSVYEYVKKLKPKYRTVIYLHYFEGYSTKEIAVILKMTQSAVTTQLSRARNQLKEDITQDNKEVNSSFGKLQKLI